MTTATVTNPDEREELLEQARDEVQEEKQKKVEVYGQAQELFDARSRDTFTIERHGVEIEFLYPDPETQKEFEDRQQRVLEGAQSGADLFELLQEAQVGLDQMEATLSDHAVDPSFQDAAVWRDGLGFTDDEVGELYQDFMALGEAETQSQQLEMLQSLMSDDS
ncbi:hypothetical protein [Natrinema sp. DC36]|uniref:hypothetical protein n=1 Tax=Natrinema sp. DC36 TaxID=2878680 RepID=UPI001CF01B8A|nr:hypothetical protein [Natrinema sp. DC36]